MSQFNLMLIKIKTNSINKMNDAKDMTFNFKLYLKFILNFNYINFN